MSINAILSNAVSALQTSQTQIQVTSDNVANVNTPGYVRKVADQSAVALAGKGAGVEISQIRRAAERFLTAAAQGANATAAGADLRATYLDRLQAGLGDPTSGNSLFAQLDLALSAFEQAAADPASSANRQNALSTLASFLSSINAAGQQVQSLRAEADVSLADAANRVTTLLSEISALNTEITRGRIQGDATGAEQRQAELIDELSTYLDIRTSPIPNGGLEVRTTDGLLLAGVRPATVTYVPQGTSAAGSTYPRLEVQLEGTGATANLESRLNAGTLRSLVDLRDRDLPEISLALGELAGKVAEALNAASNNSTSVPAASSLQGRNTGLLASDSLGFTGRTTIAIADPTGQLVRRVDVDFTAGTLSVNGGAAVAFGGTVGGFVTSLNAALGGDGTATFTNGQLSIAASGTNGVLTQDDATNPATRGTQGFGAFFGLNDLVRTNGPSTFATGLSGTDASGFTAGQQLGFRVLSPNGTVAGERTITLGGGDFNAIVSQLNDPVNGLGQFATFSLDASGRLIQTPTASAVAARIEVTLDSTSRGTTGVSFTSLFGLGDAARATRATSIALAPQVANNPTRLPLAMADLTGAVVGDRIVGIGDSRGAQAISRAGDLRLSFESAGGLSGGNFTLGDYAARLAGEVGRRASAAQSVKDTATRTFDQMTLARSNAEGVNLDEELVKLTTYQRSYNAAARLITAATELYDTLLAIGR